MPDTPALPPVTAVVVTYQSAATIDAALAALRRCHAAGLADTVVVDNGSRDATLARLDAHADWARIRPTGVNNGFGRGCNLGAAEAATPYTLFVNPDAVVEPGAVRALLAFMEQHPDAGIVGPAIIEGEALDGSGELQMTGARPTPASLLRDALPLLPRVARMRPIAPGAEPFATGWVCGAVLMIRTDLLRRLGGFDPRFFLYWEEIDLCRRAEAAGSGVWALRQAVTRHVGGASSAPDDTRIGGCIARFYLQSRYYYLIKHHGRLAAGAAELGEFLLLGLRSLVDLARGRGLRRLRPRLQAPLFSLPEKD